MRVALTGASGHLGQFIANDLLRRGCRVQAWQGAAPLPLGVTGVPGRLGQTRAAQAVCTGADLLIHAALAHIPGRFRGGEGDDADGFVRANLHGSLELLRVARAVGVNRAVVLSSRAVFDGLDQDFVDDDAPLRPTTLYGAVKAALEAFVSSLGRGEDWHVAALRPTGVYGVMQPMHASKWHGLIADARQGRLPATDRATTEVHGVDLADAVWRLAVDDRARGRIFNCSDVTVTRREILAHAGITAPLPRATPPTRVMTCQGLHALGWRPGSRPLLRTTLRELAAGERADA